MATADLTCPPGGGECKRRLVRCSGIADATAVLRTTGTGGRGRVVLTTGAAGISFQRAAASVTEPGAE